MWGTALPLLRIAVDSFGPGRLALLRILTASAALAVYAILKRRPLPSAADLPCIVGAGVTGITLYHLALNYGLLHVAPGTLSMLVQTTPLFTALLGALVLRERISVRSWLGIGLGFAGAALIVVGDKKNLSFGPSFLAPLGAAVAWSLNMVFQKPLLSRHSPADVTTWIVWAGCAALLVYAPGTGASVARTGVATTLLVVYLGIFPIAAAYGLWAYVLSRMDAGRAASMLYLIPGIVIVTTWILFGIVPTALSVAGGLIALLGVLLVTRTPGGMR